MTKRKKSPTTRTKAAIRKLRMELTFREIVDAINDAGLKTSISHLSRILDGQREASDALADAIEAIV